MSAGDGYLLDTNIIVALMRANPWVGSSRRPRG